MPNERRDEELWADADVVSYFINEHPDEEPMTHEEMEEAAADIEAARYSTTLDVYRLALHHLGVREWSTTRQYQSALDRADGLHDAIVELLERRHDPIVRYRGKYYRLRHRVKGTVVKAGDPPRVKYQGREYWQILFYGQPWVATGHKKPKRRKRLDELDMNLGDCLRPDVPSVFTPIDLDTGEPRYPEHPRPIIEVFPWNARAWKKSEASFDEAWMGGGVNHTALYHAIDRLEDVAVDGTVIRTAELVWDWYFSGMNRREIRRAYRQPEGKLRAIVKAAVDKMDVDNSRQLPRTPTWTGAYWLNQGVEPEPMISEAKWPDPRASLVMTGAPTKDYRGLRGTVIREMSQRAKHAAEDKYEKRMRAKELRDQGDEDSYD